MTRHEAVEILEEVKMIDDSMFAYSQAYNDALDMAIEALKAQEPMLVKYTTSTIRCPKCNKQITSRGSIHNEIKYCWKCGQAVKWE